MVIPGGGPGDRVGGDNRAQLILVGAFVVATVVVGLTVLLNTTVFVDSAVPTTTSDQLDEAGQFDRQTRRTLAQVLHRANVDERNRTGGELETDATDLVDEYSRLRSSMATTSGSATVEIRLDAANSSLGERVVQAEDGKITSPGDTRDWTLVNGADPATVGWFVADVNVSGTGATATTITVDNGTDSIDYTVSRVAGELSVRADPSFAAPVEATCAPTFNRVLVDFYRGELRGNCGANSSFTGIAQLDAPHGVEVTDGHHFTAEYELVMNRSQSGVMGDCTSGTYINDLDDPCRTPALWQANVTTAYLGSTTTYRNAYNLSIYAEEGA